MTSSATSPSDLHDHARLGLVTGLLPAPRVGPGLAAQACGLACERLIRLALAGTLEEPGHLGEQVGPPAGELAQPGHRGALLGGGEIAPLRMMARLAEQLGDEDAVSLRALVDHVF